jgi:hypothetical protein
LDWREVHAEDAFGQKHRGEFQRFLLFLFCAAGEAELAVDFDDPGAAEAGKDDEIFPEFELVSGSGTRGNSSFQCRVIFISHSARIVA